MKNIKLILLFAFSFLFINCADDFDDTPIDNEVNEFIWRGLNNYYLWQKDKPELSDANYLNQGKLFSLYKNYPNPISFFNFLKVDGTTDRFSVIYDDYKLLEQVLSGTENSNGVDYEIRRKSSGSNDLFGFVRYVLPNSDAASKNIQRGDIFYAVNGTSLTIENYRSLLANNSYTLNMASYNSGNITPNNITVNLTKTTYSENPVFYTNVYTVGAKKVGYLVYNGFYSQYENQLNTAITNLKSQNISHLILDLRYNPGGSVSTAVKLAGMITGQFNGQVFAKQQWNSKITAANNSESFINRFTNNLNNTSQLTNLNLTKLYVITAKSSASASELLINGLKPYIDVVQIGATTSGKNVGSVTLYDSPNFGRNNLNTKHNYAMQPIVFKIANKQNFSDYANGLVPNVMQVEDVNNIGVIGNINEPLLQTTLNYIDTNGRYSMQNNNEQHHFISDKKHINLNVPLLYINENKIILSKTEIN